MSGGAYERELCRWLRADGWHAQRTAASGSATDADLPDVTFARNGHAYAVEAKTTSEPYIYVDQTEVTALERYADAYGMVPLIAGRFKGTTQWHLWLPERMARTDAGTYKGAESGETRRVIAFGESDVPSDEWLLESVMAARTAVEMDSEAGGL